MLALTLYNGVLVVAVLGCAVVSAIPDTTNKEAMVNADNSTILFFILPGLINIQILPYLNLCLLVIQNYTKICAAG
jgi:uncharacterized integral membrane protein